MLIVDGHLDLALNARCHERDLRLEVTEIRRREGRGVADGRGICMVSLPELRRGEVALVTSTVLARCKPWIDLGRTINRDDLDYPDATMCYSVAQGELAYYRLLETLGELCIIESVTGLDRHIDSWVLGNTRAIGLIVTMEGADPIVEPQQIHQWYRQGLRTLMLAHFGRSRYAAGTPSSDPANTNDVDGPLTNFGIELLDQMQSLNMSLDLSHCSDQSFFDAINAFNGPIYASHSTCRALVPAARCVHAMRMQTDEQLQRIIERDGVIGLTMFNAHLQPEDGPCGSDKVSLTAVVDHVDHICQLAGSAAYVAIGSDLDGGFGTEHTPIGLDTIADLAQIGPRLRDRGFGESDVEAFFGGNWLRFWRRTLPAQ